MTTAANDDGPQRLLIGDADLRAYAEGRLDAERRRAVEGYLACNPDVAAEVMRHLHMTGSPRKRRRPAALAAMIGLAACLGSGLGWAAAGHQELDGWRELDGGPPPEYVEEAAEVRQAAILREHMASQVETARLDVAEIYDSLRIDLPALPPAWRVRDVQVFPTDDGPGVSLVLDTPEARRLQLFVVRIRGADRQPEIAGRAGERVVFWQKAGAAYVLSGPRSVADLRSDADVLGATRRL